MGGHTKKSFIGLFPEQRTPTNPPQGFSMPYVKIELFWNFSWKIYMLRMVKYAIWTSCVFSLKSSGLLTDIHPKLRTNQFFLYPSPNWSIKLWWPPKSRANVQLINLALHQKNESHILYVVSLNGKTRLWLFIISKSFLKSGLDFTF